jgi:hypothetical protein
MTKEQFAQILNGRQYRNEITNHEQAIAKEHNLLVVYGASDDLMEFAGVIDDEIGAWDGTVAIIFKGLKGWQVTTEEDLAELKDQLEEKGIEFKHRTHEIEAEWSPSDPECSWLIKTELPNAPFDIMEDGELYCRGAVIDLNGIS